MNQLPLIIIAFVTAFIVHSCNQSDPSLQRNAAFEICGCMETKDALMIRDTLAMHDDIRMLNYTQCIFEFAKKIDPFDPSFRKILHSTCTALLPLHDAFIQAGTKSKKVAN